MNKKSMARFVSQLPLQAGESGEYELEIIVGQDGIAPNGGFLIYPPITTMPHVWSAVFWKFSGVFVRVPRPCKVDARIVRADRFTYAESNAELIRIVNAGPRLPPGTVLQVTLLDVQVQTFAMKGAWFRVEEDALGEGPRVYSAPLDSLGHANTWDCYKAGKRRLKNIYIDVIPSEPHHLVAVLSSRPDRQGKVYLYVRAEDRFGNVTVIPDDSICIKSSSKRLRFPKKVFLEPGFLTFRIPGKMIGKGTDCVTVRCPEARLEARSSYISTDPGWNLFFGDLHGHTALSDGLGTGEAYFEYGRDASFLDFLCLTDHNRFDGAIIRLTERFNKPGSFITLFGRERGTQFGHRNLYGLDAEDVKAAGEGDVWKVAMERNLLVIPHQVNIAAKHHWKEASFDGYDPSQERLVEITQTCGSFETEKTGGPVLDGGYGSSAQSALAKGRRFGFVGGSDTHRGQPGKGHATHPVYYRSREMSGLTVVLAEKLRRESIWEALYSRRTYATTGARMLLNFKVNGASMGSELPRCKRVLIEAFAAGTTEIETLEIIKDNQVFFRKQGKGRFVVSCKRRDNSPGKYYYLRVCQKDGHYAYASPVWIGA